MNSAIAPMPSRSTRFVWVAIGLLLTLNSLGCAEGRKSTHELEHVVPAHWPANLDDAAAKIEAKMTLIQSNVDTATSSKELLEIISWIPEVAADTAMQESNWNTLHANCMRIDQLVRESPQLDKVQRDLLALCAQLRQLHSTLATAESIEN